MKDELEPTYSAKIPSDKILTYDGPVRDPEYVFDLDQIEDITERELEFYKIVAQLDNWDLKTVLVNTLKTKNLIIKKESYVRKNKINKLKEEFDKEDNKK